MNKEDRRLFDHRVNFFTSLLEGHAPASASISLPKRYMIRDQAKRLTGRQKESLAMLVVALEMNESDMHTMLGNQGVIEVIERIGN